MIIESSAPARIDLAGGTIDIWPLYLFHHGALTLNVAIDLYAVTRINTREDSSITIRSVDQKLKASAPDLPSLGSPPGLELIVEALRFFGHHQGMEITVHCFAPAGSGLGGSSALLIPFRNMFSRNLLKLSNRIQHAKRDVFKGPFNSSRSLTACNEPVLAF